MVAQQIKSIIVYGSLYFKFVAVYIGFWLQLWS